MYPENKSWAAITLLSEEFANYTSQVLFSFLFKSLYFTFVFLWQFIFWPIFLLLLIVFFVILVGNTTKSVDIILRLQCHLRWFTTEFVTYLFPFINCFFDEYFAWVCFMVHNFLKFKSLFVQVLRGKRIIFHVFFILLNNLLVSSGSRAQGQDNHPLPSRPIRSPILSSLIKSQIPFFFFFIPLTLINFYCT